MSSWIIQRDRFWVSPCTLRRGGRQRADYSDNVAEAALGGSLV